MTAFGAFAMVLRASSDQVRGIALYLLALINNRSVGLEVSCAIWIGALVLFVLSFRQYILVLSGAEGGEKTSPKIT